MTQAVTQAPPSTIHHQENQDTVQTIIGQEEGPASKRIKWEVEEDVDLLDVEQDNVVELDDDDDTPLPLTFNTSADLLWKLQKAAILPARSVLPSQRPAIVRTGTGRVRTDQGRTEGEELHVVKKERKEKDQPENDDDTVHVDLCSVEDGDVDKDCYEPADLDKMDRQKAGQLSRPSMNMAKLLNRPPRLGLSKLDRKFNNLHQVSIIEKEE